MFEEKVVDFIFELADVTDKKVSLEELTANDEDEAPKAKKKPAAKKAPAKKAASKAKK